jgi:surfactin synthase thioesterase subunit
MVRAERTLGRLGQVTASQGDADRWVHRFHPGWPAARRLVCFPYAGGSASFYFPMFDALRPAVEVIAVQYPGRQERRDEPAIRDLLALADRAAEALLPLADRPLAFFGHSMGAVVAYEVARRWEERHGIVLRHLYASGRRAPSRYREETVHKRDDAGLLAELTQLGGPGLDLLADEEIRALLLPVLRGDYTAIETYRHPPGPPLRCPITALIGDSDPRISLDDARAWGEHTSGPVELRVFPGGHFYLADAKREVIGILAREPAPVDETG